MTSTTRLIHGINFYQVGRQAHANGERCFAAANAEVKAAGENLPLKDRVKIDKEFGRGWTAAQLEAADRELEAIGFWEN
ncbi:MAG: hypothetical protein ACREQ5_00645 [Candidatus Dormibacteria bacterium]